MYKEIKSLYYLSKLKYFLKNPLVWFVIIDWALTQYIVWTWIGFESNPIVDYLGFNTALVVSLLVVSFIPKGFFRWALIAWYCFIISRHLLIIFWVI